MKYLLLFIFSTQIYAIEKNWLAVYKITQQHPEYRSGEIIHRPAGTFQLLFSLHYFDKNGRLKNDCVWYRIPEKEKLGELRVISQTKKCQNWNKQVSWVLKDIRSLTFNLESNSLKFQYTDESAKLKNLKFDFLNISTPRKKDLFNNSTPERSYRGVFFLHPESIVESLRAHEPFGNDQDCSFDQGTCQRCPLGVKRLYGSDKSSFKCGIDRCGEKDNLACYRGSEWKREREAPTCRQNPWHLYCQQGLRLECEGELGFCR